MGDGYVVSPTDLLHASQTLDSAVDQLKDASDQLKQATLPDGTLGIDKYLAAITTAFNTSISAREKDIKSCAEILDGMVEALGDSVEALGDSMERYFEHEKLTAEQFNTIRENYEKTMDEATDKYDPFKAPELKSDGTSADGSGDPGASDDGSGTGDGSDTAGGTDSGSASAPGDAGGNGGDGGAGACGEHPLSED